MMAPKYSVAPKIAIAKPVYVSASESMSYRATSTISPSKRCRIKVIDRTAGSHDLDAQEVARTSALRMGAFLG
jgi:hypothetical protein